MPNWTNQAQGCTTTCPLLLILGWAQCAANSSARCHSGVNVCLFVCVPPSGSGLDQLEKPAHLMNAAPLSSLSKLGRTWSQKVVYFAVCHYFFQVTSVLLCCIIQCQCLSATPNHVDNIEKQKQKHAIPNE